MSELFGAFGIDWKLLGIQAINFGVLLSVLTYFLYKPLLKIIDDRRMMVAEGVRTAQEAERVLADSKKERERMVGEAAREAEALIATARSRAEEKGSDIVRTAEMKAHTILQDAAMQAEEAKRRALSESEKEITKAAVLAAEKILREKAA